MPTLQLRVTGNGTQTMDYPLDAFIESVVFDSGVVGGAATATLEETTGAQEKICNAVPLTASGKKTVDPRKTGLKSDGTTATLGDARYQVQSPLKLTIAGSAGGGEVVATIKFSLS